MNQPITFGKYVLLERVNVGGMAEVFKAKAFGVEGFERLVAVKRILPNIAEDREFITMFIDEAKIAVQLTHANIAQIFDLGKVGDAYFIAMEYVSGKDLRAIFDRSRKLGQPLATSMACYVIMKVCEGLDYAHNKRDSSGQQLNLVHRDVSPQNLLLSYDGETKIIDFGIAKAAGKAGKTQAGILKGKFGYMSPEQVRGLPLDRRSDIFALGIVLYELLTGERCFLGQSDFSTLEKVRNVEIEPPTKLNDQIPEELERIVLKALAPDVDERYQAAMDLHDDLQGFMYTSGNFFSRKELSAFMRSTFAEEIALENARDEEFNQLDIEPPVTNARAELPEARPPSSLPKGRGKRTIMGMGSIPPPPLRAGAAASSSPPPKGGESIDWDDDEVSTGIYDRPDDVILNALPDLEVSSRGNGSTPPLGGPGFSSSPSLDGLVSSPGLFGDGRESSPPIGFERSDPLHTPSPPGFLPSTHSVPGAPSPFVDLEPDPRVERPAAPRRGRLATFAMVATVVLLLAASGTLAYVLLRTQPGTLRLVAEPEEATLFVDGRAVEGDGSGTYALSGIEPGAHLLELRLDGHRTWARQVEMPSGGTLLLPDIQLESEHPGRTTVDGEEGTGFRLDTNPSGATLYVDGVPLETPTPVTITDLAPGVYTIRAELERYAAWQSEVDVPADVVLSLPRAVLTLRTLSVRFSSVPTGASVRLVRGNEVSELGETPVTQEVDVASGPWTVDMTHPDHDGWSAPLVPPAQGATLEVTAELVERARRRRRRGPARDDRPPRNAQVSSTETPGTLEVQTQPWSRVFVDGRLVGPTPLTNVRLSPGRHTLTFVNEELEIRERVSVTIRAGETERVVRTLTPGG